MASQNTSKYSNIKKNLMIYDQDLHENSSIKNLRFDTANKYGFEI